MSARGSGPGYNPVRSPRVRHRRTWPRRDINLQFRPGFSGPMAREGRAGTWLETNNIAEQSREADMGSLVQDGVLGGTSGADQSY